MCVSQKIDSFYGKNNDCKKQTRKSDVHHVHTRIHNGSHVSDHDRRPELTWWGYKHQSGRVHRKETQGESCVCVRNQNSLFMRGRKSVPIP